MNEPVFIKDFKTFVDEISAENSRNYKISVLEKYNDNDCIKYFLRQVFNPYIVFGISEKKLNKLLDFERNYLFSMLGSPEDSVLFDFIAENNTGTDAVIATIQKYKKDHIADDCKDLFDKVITKKLSIGVDAKTINKVMPQLIPEFSVMLAEKYFEDPDRIKGKPFAITRKIDGGRIVAIKEHGEVSFYTRQGQKYEGLVDLEEEMLRCLPDNICLDGEITLLTPGELASKDQYKHTMEITRADGEKHGIKMLVFDCMTADEFWARQCKEPYFIRRANLLTAFSHYYIDECHARGRDFEEANLKDYPHYPIDKDEHGKFIQAWRDDQLTFINTKYTYFNILSWLYVTWKDSDDIDISMIRKILDEQVAAGEEGIMLNVLDAPYEFRCTWNLQKVKKMQTLDLEIVGYYEGKGKYKGTLGGFEVRYKDGNIVRVGSGIDDVLRKKIWEDPSSCIGKIIEVQYFEETSDKIGKKSLRFPIFRDFRTDKNMPDY